jgi:hypothetical protein
LLRLFHFKTLLRLALSALLVAMAEEFSAFGRLCDRHWDHAFPHQISVPNLFQHIP